MSWRIFPAGRGHIQLLREICISTFSETYELFNTPENFRKYIEEHFNEERLLKDVNDADSFTYLLEKEHKIEGYLKLNRGKSQTEQVEGKALEIERIYLSEALHGTGLGKALMAHAIEKARELKMEFLWLGVWEKNERALRFYESQGFVKFGRHIFRLGKDDQMDYLLKLAI